MGAKTSFQTVEMAVCHIAYKSQTLIHLRFISSGSTLSETLAQWRSRTTMCTPLARAGNVPLISSSNPQRRSVWCWEISLTHPVTTWLINLIENPRRPNVESGDLAALFRPCINIFIRRRYLLSLFCLVAEKIYGYVLSFPFFSFVFVFFLLLCLATIPQQPKLAESFILFVCCERGGN